MRSNNTLSLIFCQKSIEMCGSVVTYSNFISSEIDCGLPSHMITSTPASKYTTLEEADHMGSQ